MHRALHEGEPRVSADFLRSDFGVIDLRQVAATEGRRTTVLVSMRDMPSNLRETIAAMLRADGFKVSVWDRSFVAVRF